MSGRLKLHCLKGHALTGDNLVWGAGYRRCLTCKRATARTHAARRRGSPLVNAAEATSGAEQLTPWVGLAYVEAHGLPGYPPAVVA